MRRVAADAVLLLVALFLAFAFWFLPSGDRGLAPGVAGANPPPPPVVNPPPGPEPPPPPPPPPAGNFQPNQPPPPPRVKPAGDPAVNFLPADANVPTDVAPALPGPSADLTAAAPAAGVTPPPVVPTSGGSGDNGAGTAAAGALALAGVGLGAVAVAGTKKPPAPDCDELWRRYTIALDWERKGWDVLQSYTDRSGEAYQKAYVDWQGRNAGRHAVAGEVRAAGCGSPDA